MIINKIAVFNTMDLRNKKNQEALQGKKIKTPTTHFNLLIIAVDVFV
ncbi:MAG: hypothetical protein ACON5F_11410 [Jejuia sp.]